MVAGRVDAQAAEVHKTFDGPRFAGVQQAPKGDHIHGAIIVDRAPVAHLGRGVHHTLNAGQSFGQHIGFVEFAADERDAQLIEDG